MWAEDIFWRTFFLWLLLMIPAFRLLEDLNSIGRPWVCFHVYLAIGDKKATKSIFLLSLVRSSNKHSCMYILHAQLHIVSPGPISWLVFILSELQRAVSFTLLLQQCPIQALQLICYIKLFAVIKT